MALYMINHLDNEFIIKVDGCSDDLIIDKLTNCFVSHNKNQSDAVMLCYYFNVQLQ